MARNQIEFICQSCNHITSKWAGQCEKCYAWDTLKEEKANSTPPIGRRKTSGQKGQIIDLTTLQGNTEIKPRSITGIDEFDRVCGGGIVEGSAILLGGDPGIGKSTILMQAAAAFSKQGKSVIYISGEEAISQLRMRAKRLNLSDTNVLLGSETNISDILATLKNTNTDLVIIDSIQTVWTPAIDSTPGTVSQVRASAQELIHYTKTNAIALILVGHVTKEGQLAGPRILEHMVDTVIYFEGEKSHQFRILRSVKNRFGPTDEIGVFEMQTSGLEQVKNPSALFLQTREQNITGTVAFASIEGTRPVLVEIQALAVASSLSTPRRSVVGWDQNRLPMILAVLEARCNIRFAGYDIFLNIAGGLRIQETAADLAIAAALISALHNKPIDHNIVAFGEISLSGAVRPVPQSNIRLKEASKLGLTKAFTPPAIFKKISYPAKRILQRASKTASIIGRRF